MRVAMVGPFALHPKGTVPVRMLPIARALRDRGYATSLHLFPYDNRNDSGRCYRVEGVDVLNAKMSFVPLLGYFLSTLRLVSSVLGSDPAIIHVFKPKGYSGLAAMSLILLRKLRLVSTPLVVDTDDWEGLQGFGGYFLKHRLYSRIMVRFFDFQEGWISMHCDAITAASKTLVDRTTQSFGVEPRRVFYVPNGSRNRSPTSDVATIDALRRRFNLQDRVVMILYTRFLEFKVDRLLEILRMVAKRLPNARLMVVGKGFHEEEALLQAEASARGLDQYLVYAGWVEPEEIQTYIAAAQIAIYPFDDTIINRAKCPGKLVELLEYGKPVVTEAVGETTSYINNGSSGILVSPGDTESFVRAVIQLAESPSLREKLGQGAIAEIARFNWDNLVSRVESAYRVALTRN